jgi:hypothetical protein
MASTIIVIRNTPFSDAAPRAEPELRHDRIQHVAHHQQAEHDHQADHQLRPAERRQVVAKNGVWLNG